MADGLAANAAVIIGLTGVNKVAGIAWCSRFDLCVMIVMTDPGRRVAGRKAVAGQCGSG